MLSSRVASCSVEFINQVLLLTTRTSTGLFHLTEDLTMVHFK